MADFSFVDGNVPSTTDWNTKVRDQLCVIVTSSTRPASPVSGRMIYETDTNREMRYDGSAWVQVGQIGAWSTYTPSWTSTGTAPAIGNGTITGRYQLLYGRTWFVQMTATFGSTSTFGTGTYRLSLPTGLTVKAQHVGSLIELASTAYFFGVTDGADGNTYVDLKTNTSTTNTAMAGISGTVPATLASGNIIHVSVVAESQA